MYDITQGKTGSHLLYFSAIQNGEAETVTMDSSQHRSSEETQIELDFDLQIETWG